MNKTCIPILCMAFATATLNAQVPASPPAAQDAAAQIAAETEKSNTALQAWYLAGLDQLLSARAAAGDLEGVVAIKAERERMTNRQQTTPAQMQAMPAPLRKLRDTSNLSVK